MAYKKNENMIIVLHGRQNDADFAAWFFNKHVARLLACGLITFYAATLREEEPGIKEAMAGTGADNCPYGIAAIDYVRGADWSFLRKFYAGSEIIGAYLADEYVMRPYFPQRAAGEKWPEPERVGLLRRAQATTHAEAMDYWLKIHAPKALEHHTGLAAYYQNHICEKLFAGSPDMDGLNNLLYWNTEAIRYGHFSRPDSGREIMEDCANFRSSTFALAMRRYVFRQD